MASRSYSVAEARENLAKMIRDAERGRAVEITRHGRPVAVLLSAASYLDLAGESRSFSDAIDTLRKQLRVAELGIDDQDFDGLRDPASGREVRL
jgi:prevent-host-death family protein